MRRPQSPCSAGASSSLFDERGFAAIALRAGAPIVPVAILGSPVRRIEFRAPIRRSERDSGYDRLDDRQRNAG